ncbi:MAG: IS110 family transposase [Crocinitomicaceae bacterium]
MNEISFETVGIDVSYKTLDICFGTIDVDRNVKLLKTFSVPNNLTGFKKLLLKINKRGKGKFEGLVVMEATGVYHENIAYFLDENQIAISIVLPNVMSNYMKSLSLKSLDDKTCSKAIAQFGLERKLEKWQAPDSNYRHIRQLTRERSQVIDERTCVKNKLHADKNKANPLKSSLKRAKRRIAFLDKQEQEINKEIQDITNKIDAIKRNVDILESIPGVGYLTAVSILAETNNFDLIKSKKQVTSYAGYDIVHKTSGTSVNSKEKISKKGNKYIRKALHFPALSAIKVAPHFKDLFLRITKKTGIKMKGAVAVQRKILELSYSLVKKNEFYINDYEKSRVQKNPDPTQDRINLPLEV